MKMHNRTIMATVAGLSLLTGGTLLAADTRSDTDQRGQLSEKDYKWVKEAAQGGMSEVKLGELARQKGTDPSVKSFGEKMVTDHTKANNELRDIVTRKGATLPAEQERHERSTFEHLDKQSGAEFDKAYAEHMVKDHQKDIKEFQKAAQDLSDPDLKAFAQKTLPALQQHQQMAQQMQSTVSAGHQTTATTGQRSTSTSRTTTTGQ
jgi:putative membrane protein